MKKLLNIFLISIIFLTSCITAKLTTIKDMTYEDKLNNNSILVIMRGTLMTDEYLKELKTLMTVSFNQYGINSSFYIVPARNKKSENLTLDSDNDIENQIKNEINSQVLNFKPKYIMSMTQTTENYVANSLVSQGGGTLDVKLFEFGRDKMVWRGNLDFYSNVGIEASASKSNNRLFEKMKLDNLLK